MQIRTNRKRPASLLPTDILYQTSYWGAVKARLGWKALAVDFRSQVAEGDVLVLTRPVTDGLSVAYVPHGPENGPPPDDYGRFLEALSEEMRGQLDPSVAFLRFDLPWESAYASDPSLYDEEGHWKGAPDTRLAEIRMNFGTVRWNLRRSAVDVHPPDTVVIDLDRSEEELLAAMRPKTRYNVRLAARKGVDVHEVPMDQWPRFHGLYRQTAARDGFTPMDPRHFAALAGAQPGRSEAEAALLLAEKDGELLAGAVLSICRGTASYLHGASSDRHRDLMAPAAGSWASIRLARTRGCARYDLCGLPPRPDPPHSLAGLYRFQTGIGGRIVPRHGLRA
mgnify:FL=1